MARLALLHWLYRGALVAPLLAISVLAVAADGAGPLPGTVTIKTRLGFDALVMS